MKAPEKIYVTEIAFPDNIDWDGSPISSKRIDSSDIEYIRTDAFIEKATKWLKEHITNNPDAKRLISRSGCVTLGMIIEDFKKAMKV